MAKHDKFFSRSLEHIELAKQFIAINLPIHLRGLIDVEHITRVDRTNTSRELDKRHRDIIYRVPFRDKAYGILFCAIEHQSTMDKLIPVRFLRYATHSLEDWINMGGEKWPTWVNLLLYHGEKSPYSGPFGTDELYQSPLLGNKELYLRFHVTDLTQIGDEEILSHGLCAPMEVFLKHSRDGVLELPILAYRNAFESCVDKLGDDYLFSMLAYVDSIENIEIGKKLHKFIEESFGNKKDIIMTYGQLLGQKSREEGKEEGIVIGMEKGMERGMEKGMEKGMEMSRKEIAKNMFSEGMTISTIKKVTGLNEESLKNLL